MNIATALFFMVLGLTMAPGAEETDRYGGWKGLQFANFCRQYAKEHVAPYREDPYLLGYTLCSVPVLTEMDAERWHGGWVGTYLPTWPRVLQNLGAEAPGKRVYVETTRRIYKGRIKDFNTTYKTAFSSFDDLLKAERWRWREDIVVPRKQQDDDLAFLLKILDRYWQVATKAIRSQDPNHLIWGNKLGANTDIPNEVVALSSQYMDLNFMGIYGSYDLHELRCKGSSLAFWHGCKNERHDPDGLASYVKMAGCRPAASVARNDPTSTRSSFARCEW